MAGTRQVGRRVGDERRLSDRWTEDTARVTLAERAASNLSNEQFARERGFSPQRLYYWQHRLGVSKSVARLPEVEFVPVTLPRATLRSDPSGPAYIEILRNGIVIRVREDLDVSHIARLVDALSRGQREC